MKGRLSGCLAVFSLVLVFFMGMSSSTLAAGSFTKHTFGGKSYKLYVPSSYQPNAELPLVVMLHGCTQDADQFATGTQMNVVAEQESFLVMYPEQPSSADSSKCWKWFERAHQSRGGGEPATIAGMVQQVLTNYSIDEERVYVTGLSAGGAMSAIMGATYPDLFAAIGVGAGLEYKAATTQIDAWMAMSNGGPDPVQQGNLAYQAMGTHKRVVPVITFHGTSDYTVRSINGDQVISQWATTNNLAFGGQGIVYIDDIPDEIIQGQVPGGRSYTRYLYYDKDGKTILEKYMVDGMGHAWSGGSSQGSYTDPKGPNAGELMWQFFKNHPKNGLIDEPPIEDNAPHTIASPKGGTFFEAFYVELTANKAGTTYYTTDGTEPTTDSPVYQQPILIDTTMTLKFFTIDGEDNREETLTKTVPQLLEKLTI